MSTTQRRIGRYLLFEPVGRGAMGIVYRAEDPLIHRTVAVKVLHPPKGLTPEQNGVVRERFRREAQAAGGIDHPHVVRIFDVGEEPDGGEQFIVMEYLSGPSLEEMINGADLGLNKAADIIGQIAAGLDAAHEHGIVHRDIKPSNILFTEKGAAKIVDFGITQVASSCLTQSMTKLGTPSYMSPEQVTGMLLDSRADLFSMGVLCYEMLTGRKPFTGTDVVSIAYAIAHTAPAPVSTANPQLPQALDPVLARMLEKEPADRFGNAKDFHEALLGALMKGVPPRSPRPARRGGLWRPALWGLGAVAALAAIVALLVIAPSAGDRAEATAAVPAVAPASTPAPASTVPRGSTAAPAPSPTAAPQPAPAPVPTTKLTISLSHRMRRGTLSLSIDGARIFNEEFVKPRLVILQTTTWDPVNVSAGTHKLRARVRGEDGTVYLSPPQAVEVPRERGLEVRVRFKGDSLVILPIEG